jgi:hypothetical protein
MEKQHKNIIHIIDMTLPLITEFTRCGLRLWVMLQSLTTLFSCCNDVSPLQVVRPKSLFGDDNKRSECDQECLQASQVLMLMRHP